MSFERETDETPAVEEGGRTRRTAAELRRDAGRLVREDSNSKISRLRKASSEAIRNRVRQLYSRPQEILEAGEEVGESAATFFILERGLIELAGHVYLAGSAALEGRVSIGNASPSPSNLQQRLYFFNKINNVALRALNEKTTREEIEKFVEDFALSGLSIDESAWRTELEAAGAGNIDFAGVGVPVKIIPRLLELNELLLTEQSENVALSLERDQVQESLEVLHGTCVRLANRGTITPVGASGETSNASGLFVNPALKNFDPWMWDFIRIHTTGPNSINPFSENALGGRPFWEDGRGSDRVWTSLGRVFGVFAGIPMATQTRKNMKYSELQVLWHCFNSDAGWYANQPISNFLIEKNELKNVLGNLFSSKGMDITPAQLFGAINSQIIRNHASNSWGFERLYEESEGNGDKPAKRRAEYRENNALYNRDRDEIIRLSYTRFGGDPERVSPTFRKPNISLTSEALPAVKRGGDGGFIVDPSAKPVARIIISDDVSTKWSGLHRILQSARLEPRPPTQDDVDRACWSDPDAGRILQELINNGKDLDVELDNSSGHLIFRGKSDRLKDLYRKIMPSFIYGGEGSMITSARFNNLENSALASIQLARNITGDGLDPTQNLASGMPFRVEPAQVSLTMKGNPFTAFGQYMFADFKTGTTVDNIYAVSSVTHDFTPGNFTTSVTLIAPTDAYAAHESSFEVLARSIALAKTAEDEEVGGASEEIPEPEE